MRRSALVVAAWARYAEGVDEDGQPIEIVDRRKDAVMRRAAAQGGDRLAFLRDPDLFGDLVEDERFTKEYVAALDSLHEQGARATLEAWESDVSTSTPCPHHARRRAARRQLGRARHARRCPPRGTARCCWR